MSSVFNDSLLKSQAKSTFWSDYVTGGNVTVYWIYHLLKEGKYKFSTWIKLWLSSYMGHISTCTYYYIVCHLQSALSTGWQMACLFSFFVVPISNVTLTARETNLVEFNDTAVLMCSVSKGTSLSYVWMKGSSVVTAGEGVQFSNGGATLTIAMVTRYDEGPFKCNVSNGISNEISGPLHLNISCEFSQDNISVNSIKQNLVIQPPNTISLLLLHQTVQVT